jgi:transposase
MSVEDWAEIRRLRRSEGMPIRAIARVIGVGRNTVRRALEADGPPKYQRPRRGTRVDAVEPQVRELPQAWPRMPATVIAERIGSEHVSSDRSILEGCRRFIGCKSPALAENSRQVLPGWKWRTS